MENISIKGENRKINMQKADFESAVSATQFGKFNHILLLTAIPCCFSSVFDTTTVSYILPSAECDLSLSLQDKGILNAITYCGMITSAFAWGFLSDVLGRRRILVYGYLIDATLCVCCGLSQSMTMLLVFKYLSGVISCGPFACLMSYLSEFHDVKHRSRVMMTMGIFYSFANITLPSIAWLVLPQSWAFTLIRGVLDIKSWQIFLLICAFPGIIGGACIAFLPESPKFLMTRGRNEDALKVFQHVYSINTGKKPEEYPIKELIDELPVPTISKSIDDETKKSPSNFKGGLSQMLVMFKQPHLKNACLVYTIQFGILFGLNTFRLWVPQLFTIITEYENEHNSINTLHGTNEASLCDMLAFKVNKTDFSMNPMEDKSNFDNVICEPTIEGDMYQNALFIGTGSLFGYFVANWLINTIGNKFMLVYGLIIAGICGFLLFSAKNVTTTLVFSAIYITLSSISSTALVSSVVGMFPTSIRTMTISLLMMFGRTGSIIGNLLFPFMMSLGCMPPFIMVGSITFVCGLICLMLPKTIKKPLE